MLLRLLTTASLLILVIALNTNTQLFDPDFYLPDGEVLSESVLQEAVLVQRVIDGDTIKLENGQTVRYVGVNTPETKDPRKGIECFGREASEVNRRLVEGRRVRLEKDISESDSFGRLLRYVYVDIEGEEMMVNNYLVEKGYAVVDTRPPDVKYSEIFRQAEESAMFSNLGLWSACN
ncbi:thermonuclease family protein [Patescibacteria group bacterium]